MVIRPYTVFLVACHKPQAYRNLCRVKKLPGQGDHAVYQVRIDDVFADFPFAGVNNLNKYMTNTNWTSFAFPAFI
jgi:hypothetical protein